MSDRLSLSPFASLLVAIAVTLVYVGGRLFQWHASPEDYYTLNDPDVLLRLTLIKQLLQSGEWQNHVLMRMNAPFGLETPWTRIVDALVILCSAPFLPFMQIETALMAGSFVYSSAFILFYVWLAAKLIQKTGGFPCAYLMLALALLLYPSILQYMQPANIDHHSLLMMLALALTYGAAKLSSAPIRAGDALWLGAAIGVGIWTSVEFQLVAGVFYAWLGLQWCVTGERRWLRQMCIASLTATVVLTLAVLSEHPASRFFAVVYDSVSVLHIALLAGTGIAASMLCALPESRSIALRFVHAGLTAILLLSVLLYFFPLLSRGPMAEVTPDMQKEFLSGIMEMSSPFGFGVGTGIAYLFFGFVNLAGVWLIRKERRFGPYLQFLLLANLVFLILAAQAVRMACYLGPFSILLLIHIMHLLYAARPEWRELIVRPVLATALALAPLYIGALSDRIPSFLSAAEGETDDFVPMGKCFQDLIRLTENGNLTATFGDAPHTLLAYGNWGPYLLWRSPYSIIMANYHRDAQGYLDGLTVLRWEDPEKAQEILREREVKGILLCSKEAKPGLAQRLEKERIAGFTPIDGIAPENSSLRLYRVEIEKFDKTDG